MKKYFVEYEFTTDRENHYWFPIFIDADNEVTAEITAKVVETAIASNYTLKRRINPKNFVEGLNSDYINEYVNKQLVGRINILVLDIWKFNKLSTIPVLSFDEHLKLIEFKGMFNHENITNVISRKNFPVRQYNSNPAFNDNEILLINVVDHSNIDNL